MANYLKKFENHTWYENYINNNGAILPNVSLCVQENEVHYNPWIETRVVAKYNVTDTSAQTSLITNYENNVFKSMEIDGVMLDELVTEYTFGTIGEHTIKYELYDDTKLGNQAPVFYNSNLVECIIPNSVINIGQYAFAGCGNLTSVTIPNSVTSIGINAFSECSNLTSVTIPNSVTSIGSGALSYTNALKVLNYNAKCELSSSIRSSWTNLETVIIGDSTLNIGRGVFSNCTSLTSVTIGNSVTGINDVAFAGCSSLTSINIPNSVTSIGNGAFKNCSNLTSIVCNATTAPTIQSSTFENVKANGTLTVPSGSTGYDVWMGTGDYYLGKYNWTKVEQ